MKLEEISDKITNFVKRYNYLAEDKSGNVFFLLKCIVLKYLVDNHRIDLIRENKNIKKNFTLAFILGLWQGTPVEEEFWGEQDPGRQPLGDEIWDWVLDFVENSSSLEGENPGVIGSIYEESLLLNHKKRHGVFYTPRNLASYMASKVLGGLKSGSIVGEFRILDPACGSGSLLNAVYDQIFANFGEIDQNDRKNLHQLLLEKCLLGVDRDPLACLVTKLVLILKGDTYIRPLGILSGDILTEDLIDAESVDVVIGNPPYVGHKEIDNGYMKKLKIRYSSVYQDKGDLSYCFIYRGWELLKPEGQLIHITSRYFIEAFYGKFLRSFIKKSFEIDEIVDFNGLRVIEGVGVDPAIIRLHKKKKVNDLHTIAVKRFFIKNHKPDTYPQLINRLYEEDTTENSSQPFEAYQLLQADLSDDLWRLYSSMTQRVIGKIEAKTPFILDNVVQSFQGIITGNDKAFIFNLTDEGLNEFEDVLLKPWIKNKDVGVFAVAEPQKKILYTNSIDPIEKYPRVTEHLEKHLEKLKNRRECKSGKLPWYKLQWGRDPDHFDGRKIIFPYKATKNRFAIDENKCYFSADVYGLILKPRLYHQVTEEFLVILLNSRLYNYYFKSFGKKLGDKLYEYYPNTLLKLGIPDIKDENIKYFKESYDRIIRLKQNGDTLELGEILAEIDQWFYHFFELTEAEINIIEEQS